MRVFLRVLSGAFYVTASLYCFISFIPYTYLFLIKTPPYSWISGFAVYAPFLYWAAFLAAVAGFWQQRRTYIAATALTSQAIIGLGFTWKHLLASVHCDWWALVWAILLLLPILLLSLDDLIHNQPMEETTGNQGRLLPYSTGLLVATCIAIISVLGLLIYRHYGPGGLGISRRDLEFIPFVVTAHLWVAALLITALNTILFFAQRKWSRPRLIKQWAIVLAVTAGLTVAILRFVGNTLAAPRWGNRLYALVLAATVVLWATSLLSRLWSPSDRSIRTGFVAWCILLSGILIGIFGPLTADGDWNGILQDVCALLCWVLVTISVFKLRSKEASYSLPSMAGVLLSTGVLYFGLAASGFLWAHQVGNTQDEIAQALGNYELENASFDLAHKALSTAYTNECDDFCRTLRQYTNVENAQAKVPLKLVDNLKPASGPLPNIFIFVIDSLRPDYLGAYNPKVDFTPNLDALAVDSVVMRKAYTPYAGTTLAEPAIWTGALLLHSHYQHPFDNLNLMRTLAKTDGYKMVLSYDSILRRLINPKDVDVKLDADKPWKLLDLESTTKELEHFLDSRGGDHQPILFYTQPIDVQELGRAAVPTKAEANWRDRPGFNNRIAYRLSHADAAFGQFIAFLKTHDLYENSIIIVTADHGDALGDLGRRGHSYILYPEIMHIPMIVHLPQRLRSRLICDPNRLASLIDITPTLYYVLGHRPIRKDFVLGQPLFFESTQEMEQYHRDHLFMASDIRAGYGIVTGDVRKMYVTYDSPDKSYLFDLVDDPAGAHNIVTGEAKNKYNAVILKDLGSIAAFYDYKPNGGESGTPHWDRVVDVPSGYFAQDGGAR